MKIATALLITLAATASFAADATLRIAVPASVVAGSVNSFDFHPRLDSAADHLTVDGDFNSTLTGLGGFLIMGFEAPGWECNGLLLSAFHCRRAPGPAGEHMIRVRALAGNVPGQVAVGGFAQAPNETNYQNNTALAHVAIVPAPSKTDLVLRFSNTPERPPTNVPVTFTASVTNNGPSPVSNVFVVLSREYYEQSVSGFRGWNCEVRAFTSDFVCQTGPIAPGGVSRGEFDLPSFTQPTIFSRRGTLWAVGVEETRPADNRADQTITIGVAEEFTFVLLPTVIDQQPGSNGAVWNSDLALFYRGEADATLFPVQEECRICTCIPNSPFGLVIPRNVTFTPAIGFAGPGDAPGRLLYFEKRHAPYFSWSLRVRDIARQTENAGTEIPVVGESQFRTGVLELVNIPLRSEFRQMLRIYDPNAVKNAQVAIRLYDSSNFQEKLLAEKVVTLDASDYVTSPLNLPMFPGYSEVPIDGTTFPGVEAVRRYRIELIPVTPGLRFWGFVSITNNLTNLITTVSPQPAALDE